MSEVGTIYGTYEENPEFVRAVADNEGKVLYGVNTDGNFFFGNGCPQQVRDYVEERINGLDINEIEDIISFIDELEHGDENLRVLLSKKVDKESGKSIIDSVYASSKTSMHNPEWLEVSTDLEDKIIEGIKTDGAKFVSKLEIGNSTSYNINSNEFVSLILDSENKILFGIDVNGEQHGLSIQELSNKIVQIENQIPSVEDIEDLVEPIVDEKIENFVSKRIICCDGDSLTYSQDGEGQAVHAWPKVLQDSLGDGYKVFNFGVPGAPSATLVANPTCYKITSDFTIPSTGQSDFFTLEPLKDMTGVYSWTTGPVLSFGTMGGTNPCWINGVKGNLSFSRNTDLVYGSKFTRISSGETVDVHENDLALTNEYVTCKDADHMIFIGANGGWRLLDGQGNQKDIQDVDSINELIAQQDMIVKESGDLYIILSYCGWYTDNGDATPVTPWLGESMFAEKYGEHYINLREYFSTVAIQDALDRGYLVNEDPTHPTYPTSVDTQRMSLGKPAASIRALDGVHFNDVGYHLIGDLVSKRYKNLIKQKITNS